MNASWNAYTIRSLQNALDSASGFGGSGIAVIHMGQKRDRSALAEWVELDVLGPAWVPGRAGFREADLTISVGCFARLSGDVHRVDEIAGAVAVVFDRVAIALKNYPASPATAVGWVRFRETEITVVGKPLSGSPGDVPVCLVDVSAEGRIEIET